MTVERPSQHYSDGAAISAPSAPSSRNRAGRWAGWVLTAAILAVAVALPFWLSRGESAQPPVDPLRLAVAELFTAKELTKGTAELDADVAHSQAYGAEMVGCLKNLGFTNVADMGDGGYEATPAPPGRQQAFRLAQGECRLVLGYPDVPELLSDAAYAVQYLRLLDTYQCLVDADFDPGRPPGVKNFIESRSEAWNPFGDLAASGRTDVARALAVCPQPGA